MEARNQSSAGVPSNPGGVENAPQSDPGRRNKGFKMEDLSEEEQRVLRECQRDSFFYRSLPLSAGCMVGVQYMVKSGRWAPHPQFGVIPKTLAFGFFGYMLGKLSYLPNCQQKIQKQIPNSSLAAVMKGKSASTQPKDNETTPQWESQPLRKSQDDYNSFNQTPSASTESTVPAGIDDRFRPTVDKNSTNEDMPDEGGQRKVTYEDMRRRNRQQYDEGKAKQAPKQPGTPSYKDSPLMPQRPWPDARDRQPGSRESSEPTPSPPPPQGPPKRKRTNMWGDTIDD